MWITLQRGMWKDVVGFTWSGEGIEGDCRSYTRVRYGDEEGCV